MQLSRHGVGTYQGTSLDATRQGTLSQSRLSSLNGISVRELIST